MNGLAYKANAAEVFERLRLLTAREAQDRIFAAFILPTQAMKGFQRQYSGGFSTEYPDPEERIRFWDRHLSERRLIEDDSIPAAYPSEFDQGLYGGILGGDVRFLSLPDDGYVGSGWISSMVPPLLADWSEFERLRFDENSLWYQRYLRQLKLHARRGPRQVRHQPPDRHRFLQLRLRAGRRDEHLPEHVRSAGAGARGDRVRVPSQPEDPQHLLRQRGDAGGRDV